MKIFGNDSRRGRGRGKGGGMLNVGLMLQLCCGYFLDNQGRHISTAPYNKKHIFLLFSTSPKQNTEHF